MTSQSRAAHSSCKQLTLALDMTSPSSTETRRRRPLSRREPAPSRRNHRGAVARIDLVIHAVSPGEAGEVHIRWRIAGEDTGRSRVIPMQMCPECERGFRAPEPGLCRDCRQGANV